MLHDLAGNAAMLEYAEIEDRLRKGLRVAEDADESAAPLSTDDIRTIEAALADARSVTEEI
jgi:hypothetical protein